LCFNYCEFCPSFCVITKHCVVLPIHHCRPLGLLSVFSHYESGIYMAESKLMLNHLHNTVPTHINMVYGGTGSEMPLRAATKNCVNRSNHMLHLLAKGHTVFCPMSCVKPDTKRPLATYKQWNLILLGRQRYTPPPGWGPEKIGKWLVWTIWWCNANCCKIQQFVYTPPRGHFAPPGWCI